MNGGSSAVSELLGDIAAFESGNDMESAWADHSGDLFDRDICITTEVGNVTGIVLVRKDKTDRVAVTQQCVIDAANARLKFFARRHVFTVDGRSVFDDTQDSVQILAMRFWWQARIRHCCTSAFWRTGDYLISPMH